MSTEKQETSEKQEKTESEFFTCAQCMNKILLDDSSENDTNEGTVCDSCLDDDFTRCDDCGEYHLNDSMSEDHAGRDICEDCRDDHYFTCNDCDKLFHHDDERYIDGEEISVCDSCYDRNYSSCDDCGESFHCDSLCNADDNYICSSCADNGDYASCDDCGDLHHVDHMTFDDDGGGCYCESCGPDNVSNISRINNYSYKPEPIFKGRDSKKTPFIGAEIEVELKNSDMSKLNEVFNEYSQKIDFYLKRDSTLNNGVEIVTHPATLQEHAAMPYDTFFNEIAENGCRSHDTKTCGLHFHVSKYYLSKFEADKITYFLSYHQSNIERLARRKSCRWSTYTSGKLKDLKMKKDRDRYRALNVQNSDTIEFRMFRGTLRPETFRASMQLCIAIYRYCIDKKNNSEHSLNSWDRFEKYCTSLRFQELNNYMSERLND